MLPILWESSYASIQNWSPMLQYSIDGSPGKPVLIWLANNDSVTSPFDIHLNASFYGISTSGWSMVDAWNMSVMGSGAGSDIHISTNVPPKTWMPIYIVNTTSNLGILYSTATIDSATVSGSSSMLSFSGPLNSSEWVLLKPAGNVASVVSSKSGALQTYSNLQTANAAKMGYYCLSINTTKTAAGKCDSSANYDQEGWFYDQKNNLLYVHFQSGGSTQITVQYLGATTSGSSSTTTSATNSLSSSTTYTTLSNSTPSQSTTTSSVAQSSTVTASSQSSASETSSAVQRISTQQLGPQSSSLSMTSTTYGILGYELSLAVGIPIVIKATRGSNFAKHASNGWRW